MADSNKSDDKQSTFSRTDDAPKQDETNAPKQDAEVKPKDKAKVAHPAPSEYGGLPKGKDGGPVTIDNPPAEDKKK